MQEEKLHSTKENVSYMLKNWRNWNPKSIWYCVLRVPALVLMPMLTALIPKLMIDCITQAVSPGKMIAVVAMMSLLVAGLSWISPFLLEKMNGYANITRMKYSIMVFQKTMTTDYENMESIEGRERLEKSMDFAFHGRYSGSQDFFECIVQLAVNAVGILSYIALLSVLHPAIVLLIACTCLGEFLMLKVMRRQERKMDKKQVKLWMRFHYLYRNAHDFSVGKDIRLYGISDWFLNVLVKLIVSFEKNTGKYTRQTFKVSLFRALFSMVREGVAYGYLIVCVRSGKITVSDFIFYFGIITGFAGWILGLITQLHNLERTSYECDKFRAFVELPERRETAAGSAPASGQDGFSIEFKNVSFCYQGSTEATLKNISFQVKPKENIAIVGENGAGKTTCIKLLCGFYQPTEGAVLLNGVSSAAYHKAQYFNLFSSVYQDFHFLPMSVERNICLCEEEEIDGARLEKVLRQAEIWERIQELPEKGKTMMVKEVHDNAVNFSGGELQKLLLARALYRDAPILVLDEPTAALDPIAENDLYEKYGELTKEKTSFFISHRLSSTRFCDRIFFLSDGQITESGTHAELMAQKGGYYRMYEIQSHYYKEDYAAEQREGVMA